MKTNLLPLGELILAKLGIDIANLAATISPRELDHYIAVENWLTDYEPKSDATNIEKVSGYLEAFYHFCEAEALLEAGKILSK